MGLCDSMKQSVETNLIGLVLRKGYPVLPNGELNEQVVKNGMASQAWKDSMAENHIKGGHHFNPWNRKWENVDGCSWDLTNLELINDSLETVKGKITLEARGLSCVCGQYTNKEIRYVSSPEKVVRELNSMILADILTAV